MKMNSYNFTGVRVNGSTFGKKYSLNEEND